jgi:ferredoxin|tara:strand:- start:102 stop:467 length:366 start_codon:yes stop_codon:yes gene_type:complete
MTYLVVDNCIKCKHMDCVEVCPVDCFYEGENMLVINPDECIDCGVCEPECPANAIVTDSSLRDRPDELAKWMGINTKYSEQWPVITTVTENRPSAEEREQWDGVPNKYEDHFSETAGKGDE